MDCGTGFERISGADVQGSIGTSSLGLGLSTVRHKGLGNQWNGLDSAIRSSHMTVGLCYDMRIMDIQGIWWSVGQGIWWSVGSLNGRHCRGHVLIPGSMTIGSENGNMLIMIRTAIITRI